MRLSARAWPYLAIALVCLGGLANVRVLLAIVQGSCAATEPGWRQVYAARYAPLAAWLPEDAEVGFFIDGDRAEEATLPYNVRHLMAQYAIAPRILRHSTVRPWTIVDSDRDEASPPAAGQRKWTLVADLGNGLKLYRTAPGK